MTIHRFAIADLLLIICLAFSSGCAPVPDNDPARHQPAQEVSRRTANSVKTAFYNCENLFDYKRNPGKQDEDFTPEGKYHYTEQVYKQKLHNIATVIQAMNEAEGGDLAVLGMAEVENDQVLADLCDQPELENKHFGHICHQGPDPRGINTAFIYDRSLFGLISEDEIDVVFKSGGHSRPIMHILGVLNGDTTHLFINHWTSRRNSQYESEEKRITAATILHNYITRLQASEPGARIIIMGDFNDNPTDASIAALQATCGEQTGSKEMFNPFCPMFHLGLGSEKFKNEWNLFDQIILSGNWQQSAAGHLRYGGSYIFDPEFIVESGRNGETPKRGFKGQNWMNGYSDHFPVFITLSKQ